MIEETRLDLVRGSSNVFRDLGDPDADLKHAKAVLAAQVVAALDESALTVRKASAATGFAAADFSRVRNANLRRFTVDRLMRMLAALDHAASVTIHVGSRTAVSRIRSRGQRLAPERNSVIVDKSYLQGAGIHPLLELQEDWNLLFPDAFFFEVASTDKTARDRCLKKLREIHRSGRLFVAPNMGELLRREIHTLNGAGLPSENLVEGLDLDTFFGIRFDDLSRARREALQSTEADFDHGVDGLVACASTLQGRFRGTSAGTTKQRKEAHRRASEMVARDTDFITRFFADSVCQGTHPPPGAPLLAAAARDGRLGPEWTIYRWQQAQLLYGLELTERYGRLTREELTPKQRERLQHDVLDLEYLVLGVLQGALITTDKRMRGMFRLLRPDGALLPHQRYPDKRANRASRERYDAGLARRPDVAPSPEDTS